MTTTTTRSALTSVERITYRPGTRTRVALAGTEALRILNGPITPARLRVTDDRPDAGASVGYSLDFRGVIVTGGHDVEIDARNVSSLGPSDVRYIDVERYAGRNVTMSGAHEVTDYPRALFGGTIPTAILPASSSASFLMLGLDSFRFRSVNEVQPLPGFYLSGYVAATGAFTVEVDGRSVIGAVDWVRLGEIAARAVTATAGTVTHRVLLDRLDLDTASNPQRYLRNPIPLGIDQVRITVTNTAGAPIAAVGVYGLVSR